MRTELLFRVGPAGPVPSPEAARAGRAGYVGMRLADDGSGWVESGEPARVVLAGDHAVGDAAYYRKAVRDGHLKPADKATADYFGTAWLEPSPGEADAHAQAPAPAFEAAPVAPQRGPLPAFDPLDAPTPHPGDEPPPEALRGPAGRAQKGSR